MLEILKFTFSSFYIWCGVVVLICAIGWSINAIFLGLRGKRCESFLS